MEPKDYLDVITKNLYFFLALVVIGAAVGYFLATNYPKSQGFEKVFYVSKTPNEQKSQEDQNINNSTDSAVYILSSAEFQKSQGFPTTPFAVRKMAPQVIKITTNTQNQGQITTLVSSFNSQLSTLENSKPTYELKPISQNTEEITKGLNRKVTAAAGSLFGFVVALAVTGLKNYLKL